MRSRLRNGLGWAPAFVAGFAAGATATVAVALLLYTGEGLLRSLTLIVAVELGAFGLGLSAGGRPGDWDRTVESLRRRWLFALVAFLGAAGFALIWALFSGFGAIPMTQALGLALLGGLPLYASGRLLRGIGDVRIMTGARGGGGGASIGAAIGVLVTGLGALSGIGVPSFVLFMLVLLSGAALLQGWVLEAHGVEDPRRHLSDWQNEAAHRGEGESEHGSAEGKAETGALDQPHEPETRVSGTERTAP